jgi:hypothetical protein
MPAQAAHFSMSARSGFASACQHFSFLFVERLMARCALGPQASEKLLSYGPSARWPRIVYNWRDDTRLGGRMLVGTGPDAYMKGMRMLALLILAALVMATILAGCGGAGSGGSSQAPEKQQASRTAASSEQKTEGAGSSEQASGERLGHPALGSPDAPVVLTEHSDYQ